MSFFLETLRLGLNNLLLHKLRSLLTALGIIIGVAAVVAISAYGEGAKLAALREIQQLGANNIILRSTEPQRSDDATEEQDFALSYGLTRLDLERIGSGTVSPVQEIVPLKQVGSRVTRGVRAAAAAAAFGTTPSLKEVASLRVLPRGRYLNTDDAENLANVAVIGYEIAQRLFPLEDPLEGSIMIDEQPFRVVGVLAPIGLAGGAGTALVGRDLNFDVHIPMATARSRFGDGRQNSDSFRWEEVQISEAILRVPQDQQDRVLDVAEQVRRVIALEHEEAQDVTLIVPLELIQQAERTQLIFTGLIVVIASLSLLVGGIGIMNIMLASVTERTREIGIRRALGATRRHIIAQFLVETTTLSGLGGILGLGLGLLGMLLLTVLAQYIEGMEEPAMNAPYMAIAMVVAVGVGIAFGLYPAIKAANQDPIVALRHD